MLPELPSSASFLCLLCAASVLFTAGCSSPYEVRIRFSSEANRSSTTRLEVALVESCDDQVSGPATGVVRRVDYAVNDATALGSVDPGEYGLYVRAIGRECDVVATGCSQVSIDKNGGTLDVLLQPASGATCINGFFCMNGECIPGGAADTGATDAGAFDTTTVDTGVCDLPVPTETRVDLTSGRLAVHDFGCFVRAGRAFCFGQNNDAGQLGGVSATDCSEVGCVVEVEHPDEGATWLQVSTGSQHACAIDNNSRLYCWGESERGGLGRASGDGVTQAADFPVSRVTCGSQFTCALKANTRTLHCWGDDRSGQTGVLSEGFCAGGPGMSVNLPTRISSPESEPCPPIASSPELELWSDVVSGGDVACALVQDGHGYCWGGVAHGSTGADETGCFPGCRATPIGRWQRLAESVLHHRCGIREDGELLCWGINDLGQVGLGFVSEDPTPELGVCDPTPGDRGAEVLLSESMPVRHPEGRAWEDVAAGFFHVCAIDDEGGVYCWGGNDQSAVGEGAPGVSPSPFSVALPDGVQAVEVAAGSFLSCVLGEDDEVYCWGGRGKRCAGEAGCSAVHRIGFPE